MARRTTVAALVCGAREADGWMALPERERERERPEREGDSIGVAKKRKTDRQDRPLLAFHNVNVRM